MIYLYDMQLSFHGAARTVTGSKHVLKLKNGKQILLDCGMFQGMGPRAEQLNRNWGFEPADVDMLILSHAHIDHSGLIPRLVKAGFKGPIFCTRAHPQTHRAVAHGQCQDSGRRAGFRP